MFYGKQVFSLSESFNSFTDATKAAVVKELNLHNQVSIGLQKDITVTVFWSTNAPSEESGHVSSVKVIGYNHGVITDVGPCDSFIEWCIDQSCNEWEEEKVL